MPLLEAMPEVVAVSPMVSTTGLATRGAASKAIALVGGELDRYGRIAGLRAKIIDGAARLEPGDRRPLSSTAQLAIQAAAGLVFRVDN